MKRLWHKVSKRSIETQGIWNLRPDFQFREFKIGDLETRTLNLQHSVEAQVVAESNLRAVRAKLKAKYSQLSELNVAVGWKLRAELPPHDPRLAELDSIAGLQPTSRTKIEERTLRILRVWESWEPTAVVRQVSLQTHQDRWAALPELRKVELLALAHYKEASLTVTTLAQQLDELNKTWLVAWKSEHPPGTPEHDALNGLTLPARPKPTNKAPDEAA